MCISREVLISTAIAFSSTLYLWKRLFVIPGLFLALLLFSSQLKAGSLLQDERLELGGLVDIYAGAGDSNGASNEHSLSYRQRLRAEARYTFRDPETSSWPGLRQQDPFILLSAQSDFLWFGSSNSYSDHDLDLYEAYLHWNKGPLQLGLGKQNVRWGKTDQLSPVDNINAQDFRQFVLLDLEDRKIPNWLARMRYFHQDWTLEGVFIPFFQAHEINYFGTDWAIYRQARQDVRDLGLPPELQDFFQGLDVRENEPANTLKNAAFGARLAKVLGNVDLAASWLYTREPMPYFASFPVRNLQVKGPISARDIQKQLPELQLLPGEDIQVEYPRTRIYGLEFESILRDFGIRGEAAYFDQQSFLQQDLTSTRKRVLHIVAGLDYDSPGGWYANLQLSEQYLFDYQSRILFFARHNFSVLGELSHEWARGRWQAALQGMYYFTDQSWHANPELTYNPAAALDISLGLHMFQGTKDTILGQYRDNDHVYLRLKYYF